MTSRSFRPRRRALAASTLAAAAAATIVLSACDPVQAGSAAIVGPDTISEDTLQNMTTRVLDAADAETAQQLNSDTAALQRQELSRLIDAMVLEQAARNLSVKVTEGEIDARLAQLEQQAGGESQLRQQAVASGIAPADLREVVRDIAISDKLAIAVVSDVTVTPAQLRAEYQKNIDTYNRVHAAHILVQTKAKADALLQQVKANPSSFATLAQKNSIDTNSASNGGDLGTNGAGSLDPTFAQAIFAAKPGSYIVVHTRFGWHVVHVISHESRSLAQATPELRSSLLKSQSDRRLSTLLEQVAHSLDITVNPRYGKWDPSQRAVTPPPNTLSKPESTPTPSPTAQLVPGQQQQQPPSG